MAVDDPEMSDEDRALYGVDELRHTSDGGLRIMQSHLREAYDRIGRAADRDDHIDLNEPAGCEGAPSSDLLGAAALIDQTIESIDRELADREDDDEDDEPESDEAGRGPDAGCHHR